MVMRGCSRSCSCLTKLEVHPHGTTYFLPIIIAVSCVLEWCVYLNYPAQSKVLGAILVQFGDLWLNLVAIPPFR